MIKKNKNNYKFDIDWWCVAIYALLVIIGFLSIHSVSYNDALPYGFGQKSFMQIVWVFVALVAALVVMFVRKETIFKATIPIYVVLVIVQFLMIFIGKEVNGAKSWIGIGSFGIQPAEFGKIATALMLGRVISDYDYSINKPKGLALSLGVILLPIMFILLQNDTGTALVYLGFMFVLFVIGWKMWIYVMFISSILLFIFSMIFNPVFLAWIVFLTISIYVAYKTNLWFSTAKFIAGIALLDIALSLLFWWFEIDILPYYTTILSVLLLSPIPIYYALKQNIKIINLSFVFYASAMSFTQIVDFLFNSVLKLHQQKRILDLLGLESDVKGWGYNVNQSMIAIGSGGFFGKGYMKGTQTKYDFVPEQSTDFIFCTIGEEGGFLITSAVIVLFMSLMLRLIKMATKVNDSYAKIYTFGVVSVIMVHVFINIGMTIGLVPVIGIPLPLISYGGSSLLSFTVMIFLAIKLCSENKYNTYY